MKRIIHKEWLEIFSRNIETAEDDAKDTAFGEFAEELTGYCRIEKTLRNVPAHSGLPKPNFP